MSQWADEHKHEINPEFDMSQALTDYYNGSYDLGF